MSCPVDYMNAGDGLWTMGTQESCDLKISTLATSTILLLSELPPDGGSSAVYAIKKAAIASNLATIVADTDKRLTYANRLSSMPTDSIINTATIQTQDSLLTALRNELDEKQTLYNLRQGQASSLADKYAPAAYSAWWPLWFPVGDAKPLSDSTRTALYLFTGASMLYLAAGGSGSGSRAGESEDNQTGGSRARKIRR